MTAPLPVPVLQGRMNQMQSPALVKKLSGDHENAIGALLAAGADPMVGHLSALWYSASFRNTAAMKVSAAFGCPPPATRHAPALADSCSGGHQLFLDAKWPTQPGQKANVADYADGGWSLLHEVVASKASGMA